MTAEIWVWAKQRHNELAISERNGKRQIQNVRTKNLSNILQWRKFKWKNRSEDYCQLQLYNRKDFPCISWGGSKSLRKLSFPYLSNVRSIYVPTLQISSIKAPQPFQIWVSYSHENKLFYETNKPSIEQRHVNDVSLRARHRRPRSATRTRGNLNG